MTGIILKLVLAILVIRALLRLARGIATGSVLEFANKEMLADALRGRQDF